MRLLTAALLALVPLGCSSTTSPNTNGSSSSSSSNDDQEQVAAPIDPATLSGTYVFQAASCAGVDVKFIGYKETVTLAGGKATSVTETSGCKATVSDAPIRGVTSTTFEIVYSAGTQACAPNPCNAGYDVIVGSTRSTVPPTKCESGPVLSTGGTPPRFAPAGDTLQATMMLAGTQCVGQYIKL